VQWGTYQVNYLSAQNAITGWSVSPFLNSETNFNGSNGFVCPSSQYTAFDCAGQVVRWWIMHASNGAIGHWWYYFNTTLGQLPGSTSSGYFGFSPTLYWAQQYMVGGYFTSAAALSTGTTWTAPFVTSSGVTAKFVWTTSEAGASYTVPSGYGVYKDLVGITHVTSGGSVLAITTQPILLLQANIKVFEGWNEWDLCHYWTGTPAQLYAMLAYPTQLIRAAIPGVVITTPSEEYTGTTCQSGYEADLTTWLTLENTDGRISDIVDWHGYLAEGFNFHVPFQSGQGPRQANVAASAQKMTQPTRGFLIDFAFGAYKPARCCEFPILSTIAKVSSVCESVDLPQEISDEANTADVIYCHCPPKVSRFLGARG
jgi:hypothetical protein